MRLAICSNKGGVGKTSVAANLAAALGQRARTLAVDADPQDSLGRAFGVIAKRDDSLAGMLGDPNTDVGAVIRRDVAPGVDLLPAHPTLQAAAAALSARGVLASTFRRALRTVQQDYEFTVLDTHGDTGILTIAAVTVADAVLTPFTSDPGSALGAVRIMSFVNAQREQGRDRRGAARCGLRELGPARRGRPRGGRRARRHQRAGARDADSVLAAGAQRHARPAPRRARRAQPTPVAEAYRAPRPRGASHCTGRRSQHDRTAPAERRSRRRSARRMADDTGTRAARHPSPARPRRRPQPASSAEPAPGSVLGVLGGDRPSASGRRPGRPAGASTSDGTDWWFTPDRSASVSGSGAAAGNPAQCALATRDLQQRHCSPCKCRRSALCLSPTQGIVERLLYQLLVHRDGAALSTYRPGRNRPMVLSRAENTVSASSSSPRRRPVSYDEVGFMLGDGPGRGVKRSCLTLDQACDAVVRRSPWHCLVGRCPGPRMAGWRQRPLWRSTFARRDRCLPIPWRAVPRHRRADRVDPRRVQRDRVLDRGTASVAYGRNSSPRCRLPWPSRGRAGSRGSSSRRCPSRLVVQRRQARVGAAVVDAGQGLQGVPVGLEGLPRAAVVGGDSGVPDPRGRDHHTAGEVLGTAKGHPAAACTGPLRVSELRLTRTWPAQGRRGGRFEDGIHRVIVGQAQHDQLAGGQRLARSFAARSRPRHQSLGPARGPVPHGHRMAASRNAVDHRLPHRTQADDRHWLLPMQLLRLEGRSI